MNIDTEILQPVIALVAWSMVMWAWMYATRIPAIAKSKMQLDPHEINGVQMSQLPSRVRWKADNYNHLMEQPTIFYATAFTLALVGAGTGINVTLAWTYVGIRVLHSLVQALTNKIEVRFGIFVLSSIALIGMIYNAVCAVFG